ILKSRMGVAVCFTEVNLEILYSDLSGMAEAGITDKTDLKEKIQQLIKQKISEWQEDDIYAISLYVNDENDDPRRPVAVLGYNTESQFQASLPKASDEQEARWNYAFWLQNEELCLGRCDTAEDVRNWIHGQGLWDQEDEITEAFVKLLVLVVKDIQASGFLKDKFGKEIPLLIHELEYYDIIATQNIEANGEALVRDFALFCLQDDMPNVSINMPAPKSEIPAKKAVEKRMMFLAALVFILWLSACLYLLYLHIRDTAADGQNPGGAVRKNNVGRAGEEKEELYVPATAIPDAAADSYTLIYNGMDIGLEIFLKDCACEFNRDSIQLYSCFVDDAAVAVKGYAIYIRTPEEVLQIFPVRDYQVDKSAGRLYMLQGMEAFEGIEGIDFADGINGFTMKDTYSIEGLIGDAYGLNFSESDKTFDDLQAEFIGLYQEKGKTLLRGKASALYHITGKRYSIDWEIDTESLQENTKAFLADFDIHPLYAAFLRNEISVKNPFVPEDDDRYNTELSFFDDRDYEDEQIVFWKSFSLVDVNSDGNAELVFKMINSPSELMYILGVCGNELICFDCFETHTSHIGFGVYANGVVYDYDDEQELYCTYTDDGNIHELIHFVLEENGRISYYLEGNQNNKISLQNWDEYKDFIFSYWEEDPEWEEEPKWFDCECFADIPQK
ncbi:MAG: DUF4303 domain-containing protein, partial [Acetatifactor sp.]|nr:DUF4303 domain-containing protein [Acetatifactor sp.]